MKIFILGMIQIRQICTHYGWVIEYECTIFEKARDLIKQISFDVPDIFTHWLEFTQN